MLRYAAVSSGGTSISFEHLSQAKTQTFIGPSYFNSAHENKRAQAFVSTGFLYRFCTDCFDFIDLKCFY
jgi:hypothetical protein